MSLVGTMAKMAVGAMVAKGVASAVSGRSSGGGLGGLLGSALSGAGGSGGLGSLLGGSQQGQSGGGLGDLGALLGGNSSSGGNTGGLGGLLESIGGGGQPNAAQAPSSGSLGDLLNSALTGQQAEPVATPSQEEQAKVFIRAMVAGTKADGKVDQEEQQNIVKQLGEDLSADEKAFVISEMQSPLDVDALVKSIPNGSEQQAYMMSMMGMTLDTKEEAVFLDSFRKGLNISEEVANAIHSQLGAPTLYG